MHTLARITVLFRKITGVFSRKIVRKYTKWTTVKPLNGKTDGTYSNYFALSGEN
jgi:hypothetical protein